MSPRKQLGVSGAVVLAAVVTLFASGSRHWLLATAAAALGLPATGWFLAAWRRVFPPASAELAPWKSARTLAALGELTAQWRPCRRCPRPSRGRCRGVTNLEMRQLARGLDLSGIREACRLSLRQVAAALGTEGSVIWRYEQGLTVPRGELGNRYLRVILALRRHLEVAADPGSDHGEPG